MRLHMSDNDCWDGKKICVTELQEQAANLKWMPSPRIFFCMPLILLKMMARCPPSTGSRGQRSKQEIDQLVSHNGTHQP